MDTWQTYVIAYLVKRGWELVGKEGHVAHWYNGLHACSSVDEAFDIQRKLDTYIVDSVHANINSLADKYDTEPSPPPNHNDELNSLLMELCDRYQFIEDKETLILIEDIASLIGYAFDGYEQLENK